MPRPCCCRSIAHEPAHRYFMPQGVPLPELEEVRLALDELEALRLADLKGLYQEQAAARMKVSRATFARIVESARRKVAEALVGGKALRLEGGNVALRAQRTFRCAGCRHAWTLPGGTAQPARCPKCRSTRLCKRGQQQGDGLPPHGEHGPNHTGCCRGRAVARRGGGPNRTKE